MKYRIIPDTEEGYFLVQQKAWFLWNTVAAANSIEEADRIVRQLARDNLWKFAHKPVYYDEKGVRV
jgi:hypothetical protein